MYRALLANHGDADTMRVFADALDDDGRPQLAHAYRWAARNGKWPLRRLGRGPRGWLSGFNPGDTRVRRVYDWNREWEEESPRVPRTAMLSGELIQAIMDNGERRYGGVNRAFIILARALEAVSK